MNRIDTDKIANDNRIILTLDAGGTTLEFSAFSGIRECIRPFTLPSKPADVGEFLETMEQGFGKALADAGGKAEAISFAFPGPADYEKGIIGDLPNLKGFRGGVPLGPFLEKRFGMPVFINNDGNLFALGEWAAGFLPWVNRQLEEAGKPKRYKNLIGLTIGTGFGCGIVCDGTMITGDNGAGGEIWLLRNKRYPGRSIEATCGRYGMKKEYARLVGIPEKESPEPREMEDIALGKIPGNSNAALEVYSLLGETAGDAAASAISLIDGLVVIGGGISKSGPLFMNTFMQELNGTIDHVSDKKLPRLLVKAYNLDKPDELEPFLAGVPRGIEIPRFGGSIDYDPLKRTGVGLSRLGTGKAACIGASVFALTMLG
jgi:glucokinase